MSAPLDKPKKYSLDYSLKEDSTKIARHLKRGYLVRRDVTELIDHIQEGTAVKASFGENGKIQWTIGDTLISPSTATNKTPFWLRKIVYFFSYNSKQELKDKVEIIKKAYADLIAETAAIELQKANDALKAAELNENKEASALEEAKQASILQRKEAAALQISTLQNELIALEEDVKQSGSQIQVAEVNRDIVGSKITSLSMTRFDLRNNLAALNELDQTIENNFFGAWTLTPTEKIKLEELENSIFDDFHDQLTKKEFRISGKKILEQKIETLSDEIEIAGEQLNALSEVVVELKSESVSKKEILETKKAELETLILEYKSQALLPSDEIQELIQEVEPQEQVIIAESAVPLSELMARPLDFPKVLLAQHLDSSPFFNKKILFTSICNEDDFYKNSFRPALKSACLIVTTNPKETEKLFSKWEIEIKNLAALWKNSKSEDAVIDSISFADPFSLIEKLDKMNKLIASINYEGLQFQDFITNLSQANIPEKLNLDLQIPLTEALELLDHYRAEPTDLAPLFPDPTYKNWPKEVQYLAAVITLKFHTNLSALETDPEYRKLSLTVLKQASTVSPPFIVKKIANLAIGNSWIFDTSIGVAAKFAVPMIASKSETEELQKMLEMCLSGNEILKQSIEFSKTPGRKKFDKARIALTTTIMEDVIQSVLAKHTSDSSEIGENGKEFNLQNLILSALNNSLKMKDSVKAMAEYLEALENPNSDPEKLKEKKAQVEETKATAISCTLNLYRSFSEVIARSGNMQILFKQMDEKILPDLLKNPLDLEKTPMHEWLQHRVFEHLL